MYLLDKFTMDKRCYLVWHMAGDELPTQEKIAVLLSGRWGVGADCLVVVAPDSAAVLCFGGDGQPQRADALAFRVAELSLSRAGHVMGGALRAGKLEGVDGPAAHGERASYCEVRLTEAFFAKLMAGRREEKIAG